MTVHATVPELARTRSEQGPVGLARAAASRHRHVDTSMSGAAFDAARPGYRPDVAGLRAFAVLAVVLGDAGFGFAGGAAGLDIFFVVSGFVVVRPLLGAIEIAGIRVLPSFYLARLRRVAPLVLAVAILTMAADAAVGQAHPVVAPLAHLWPLFVAAQFYAGWPLLVGLLAMIAPRHVRLSTGCLTALMIVVSYGFAATSNGFGHSVLTRAWEPGLGVLVALGSPWFARLPRLICEAGAAAGLVGAGLAAVLGDGRATPGLLSGSTMLTKATGFVAGTGWPASSAAIAAVGAALLIAAGAGGRRRAERLLAESFMQCLGRVAFALYLWHWPLLATTTAIAGHPLSAVARVIVLWCALALAVSSYFAVEQPARDLPLARGARYFQLAREVRAAGRSQC